jgi:hypothetical protein
MALLPTTLFSVTAQAQGSLFHRDRTRFERPNAQPFCQRGDHIASMQADGRLKCQASIGNGKRALIETAMGRYKGVIGLSRRPLCSVNLLQSGEACASDLLITVFLEAVEQATKGEPQHLKSADRALAVVLAQVR